jgi:hypothetical protein
VTCLRLTHGFSSEFGTVRVGLSRKSWTNLNVARPLIWHHPAPNVLMAGRLPADSIVCGSLGEVSTNEHSERARAPHTNGPMDVPRCGALSLLQKPLHYRGGGCQSRGGGDSKVEKLCAGFRCFVV